LLTGLLLLVVSASGCLLVFAEEIDRALHPAVVQVVPRRHAAPPGKNLPAGPGGFSPHRLRAVPHLAQNTPLRH
jgi:hypothetical protein